MTDKRDDGEKAPRAGRVNSGGQKKPAKAKPKKPPKKPDIKGPRTREKKLLAEKNPVGRPTKFTHEVTSQILMAIRAGNYVETAAAFAGINKDTLYAWLKKGAAEEAGEYRDFSDGVGQALGHAEVADVQVVGKAAAEDWRAAAWRLERRNSKRWGRRDHIEVGKEKLEDRTDEELLALLKDRDTEGD